MTITEARHEFGLYFRDLKEELKRDGAKPDRQTEWENFIAAKIENDDLPEDARKWKLK